MGKTSRKQYTREFKLSLLRELESGKKLGQLSRENNIHPNMTRMLPEMKNWKGLLENCMQRIKNIINIHN